MCPSFNKTQNILLAALLTLGLTACGTMRTPEQLAAVEKDERDPGRAMRGSAADFGERYDPATEEMVAKGALDAWHKALAHDKPGDLKGKALAEARAKDEAAAMADLKELAQRFPNSSTVRLMMGQVKEHFGKNTEAAALYKEALQKNTNSSIYLFKVAEASRESGNYREAIDAYRKLLKSNSAESSAAPDALSVSLWLGLAQCLVALNKDDPEARELVKKALAAEPENKKALELDKQLNTEKSL